MFIFNLFGKIKVTFKNLCEKSVIGAETGTEQYYDYKFDDFGGCNNRFGSRLNNGLLDQADYC